MSLTFLVIVSTLETLIRGKVLTIDQDCLKITESELIREAYP